MVDELIFSKSNENLEAREEVAKIMKLLAGGFLESIFSSFTLNV